jgi:hypothetical protein
VLRGFENPTNGMLEGPTEVRARSRYRRSGKVPILNCAGGGITGSNHGLSPAEECLEPIGDQSRQRSTGGEALYANH